MGAFVSIGFANFHWKSKSFLLRNYLYLPAQLIHKRFLRKSWISSKNMTFWITAVQLSMLWLVPLQLSFLVFLFHKQCFGVSTFCLLVVSLPRLITYDAANRWIWVPNDFHVFSSRHIGTHLADKRSHWIWDGASRSCVHCWCCKNIAVSDYCCGGGG